MAEQINYQPLVKMGEIDFAGQRLDLSHPWTTIKQLPRIDKLVCGLVLLISLATMFFIGPIGMVIFIGIPSYIFGKRSKDQQVKTWANFAVANNWQIWEYDPTNQVLPPSLQKTGRSHISTAIITGKLNQSNFDIFTHQYTVKSGRDSTTNLVTIVRFRLKTSLPHMLFAYKNVWLDINKSDFGQKLTLEGDFNKYFEVYGQSNRQIDVLRILTPDVMQFLVSQCKHSVEIDGDSLYVIANKDLRRVDKLPPLLDFAAELYVQVMQNLPMANLQSSKKH